MIKYNNSNIIDWNFDDSNIIKVYHNGAIVFYKFDTEQGGYKVCYAVVDDIAQYSETEFEDVFDKATEKWYKLNNLNQYEEYGVYGSGRTSCEGSSRLPQGYTEVEYIENTSTAYINTEVLLYDSTTNSYNIQCKCYFQPYGNDFEYLFGTEGTSSPYLGVTFRYYQRNIQYADNPDNVSWTHIDNGDGTSGVTASCASTTATNGNNPLTLFCGLWSTGPWRNGRGKIYTFKVTKNNTLVRDLVPAKRDSDDKYGMYDIVNDVFYVSPNNVDFSGGEPIAPTDCVTTYDGKLTIDGGDDGEDYSTQYLTLVAQTDNVTFSYSTATSSNKLQYSVDGGSTWVDLGNNQSTSSINNGEKIMFKASGLTVNTERGIGKIIPSASASVEGNIMSLEYGDNFSGQTTIQNNYQFRKLFSGVTTITSAENMVLPATTVKQQCYSQMFQGCTNLVKTPKTIGSSAMTWSGQYCFSNMFSYCTSLTTVPSGLLPAMNLGTKCYWYMFEGCSGLTAAPDLPAPNTASECYRGMLSGCSSLNYITVLTTNNFTMTEWVSGVAASGTFVKNPNATWSSCSQNAYPCGWTVQDYVEPTPIKYEYIYSGGSWVNLGEVSGSTATLPDVPFVLNYNAKLYDSSTSSIPYTDGQLNTVNAVKQYGAAVVDHSEDGYISVTGNTRFVTTGGTTSIARNDTQNGCTMTIVSKARATSGEAVLTSRGGTSGSEMNWMWRYRTDGIFLHGSTSYSQKQYSVDTTVSPIIASVKTYYDGGVKQILKDWTNDGGYSGNFGYGSSYNGGSMFCDYLSYNSEFWKGDFYWVYMSQEVLTDEQIQQVIAYNESSGGTVEYPKYYDEIADPLDNLTFNTLAEAQAYAETNCVYVGLKAAINGDNYIFSGDSQSGYEWVEQALPYDAEIQYLENSGTEYINTGVYLNTSNFEVGYTILGDIGRWGYVHQMNGNGAWVMVSNDYAYFGRFDSSYRVAVSSYLSQTENTIVYTQSGVTVNNTTLSKSLNLSGIDNLNDSSLLYFAWYDFNARSAQIDYNSKFKSFYVKNNGVLVRDMIPVRVGQVGYMYDRVSGQLFGNAGTGSFILGPDK